MHYYVMLLAEYVLLAVLLFYPGRRPIWFAWSMCACALELRLWPLALNHVWLWYACELVSVPLRAFAALEALRYLRLVPRFPSGPRIATAMVLSAGVGYGVAYCCLMGDGMQANLWFPELMHARGYLWIVLAFVLGVAALYQATYAGARPPNRWSVHAWLLCCYFTVHAVFAFHVGDWFRSVEHEEFLSAAIYGSLAIVWSRPRGNYYKVCGAEK